MPNLLICEGAFVSASLDCFFFLSLCLRLRTDENNKCFHTQVGEKAQLVNVKPPWRVWEWGRGCRVFERDSAVQLHFLPPLRERQSEAKKRGIEKKQAEFDEFRKFWHSFVSTGL